MAFKYESCTGFVLKRINNINAFHQNGTHLKQLILNMEKKAPCLYIKDHPYDSKAKSKKLQLHTLIKVGSY